jgi:hypothetical protein
VSLFLSHPPPPPPLFALALSLKKRKAGRDCNFVLFLLLN